jgi:hypothetical protein
MGAAGVTTLGQVASRLPILEVSCNRCDRRGRLRINRLMAKLEAEVDEIVAAEIRKIMQAEARFTGRLIEWIDDRHPYGETRIRDVGTSAGELLHVVYTRRRAAIRIISAVGSASNGFHSHDVKGDRGAGG